MDYLDELEAQSIFIIREAYKQFKKIALLWSIGKDSTVLLWLCRKAFYGKIPFPIVQLGQISSMQINVMCENTAGVTPKYDPTNTYSAEKSAFWRQIRMAARNTQNR